MHDHGHEAPRRAITAAFAVTCALLVVQVIGASLTGSLALLVDSAHLTADALGLGVALTAARLAGRPASPRRTFGWARAEVLGATLQAAVLLGIGVLVVVEAVQRLADPPPVPGAGLLVFGAIGLAGNLVSAAVLLRHRGHDLNTRAAFLEVVADAAGSIGVLAAGAVIALTGWTRADAVAALLVGAVIVPRSVLLLRDAVDVLLESTPRGLDLDALREHLQQQPHVLAVHDLHATRISSALPVLSAHVVVEGEVFRNGHAPAVLDALQRCAAQHFSVRFEHATFQLEPPAHTAHEPGTHA
ncbi:cation diffusion facilitator family transporter [Amnibacterium endophyticum]|uniref:Cation diffusion facilitator family transporter n=1 Tax=Amnibacterium endophyticum TaxID=2109337 RepID=A0ABW4LBI8_9MICO